MSTAFVDQVSEVLHFTVLEDYEMWFLDTLSDYDEARRDELAARMGAITPQLLTDIKDPWLWIADGVNDQEKYEGSPATFAWLPLNLGDTVQLLVPALISAGEEGVQGYATGLLNAVPKYIIDYRQANHPLLPQPVHSLLPEPETQQRQRILTLGFVQPSNMEIYEDPARVKQFLDERKVPTELTNFPNVAEVLAVFLSSFTRGVAAACLSQGVNALRASLSELATCLVSEWHWYIEEIKNLEA